MSNRRTPPVVANTTPYYDSWVSASSPKFPPTWPNRLPFHYGWVILAASSLAMFASGPGQTFTVSVFVDPIMEDRGWSRSLVAGLYTVGSLTAAFAMPFVGRLLDRYGARVVLVGVGVLFGLAAIFMSRVEHPLELYIGFTALRILGQGSLSMIPTTLVAIWFIRMRGRAIALTALGAIVSQATLPPLLHVLISHVGWRDAWQVLAVLIWGIVLVPVVLLVRRSPESVGLRPVGEEGPSGRSGAETRRVENDFTLAQARRTLAFWLLLFAGSSHALISTALIFHQVSLITSNGLSETVATSVFSVMAPLNLVGTFVAGFLLDRLPGRYLLAAGQAILALAMLLSFNISSIWLPFVYGALLGFSGGFLNITIAVIMPNYYGRSYLGSIRGVATMAMVGAAALGPFPFGLLFDITDSYKIPVLVFLALPALCAVAALKARPPRIQEPG